MIHNLWKSLCTPAATAGHRGRQLALRYVNAVDLPGDTRLFYFEPARPDGAHDLYTTLSVPV